MRAALLHRSYDDVIHNYKYTTFFYGTDYFGMPLDDTGPFLPGDWGFEAIPRDPNGTLPPSVDSSDAGDDVPDLVDMPVLAAPSDADSTSDSDSDASRPSSPISTLDRLDNDHTARRLDDVDFDADVDDPDAMGEGYEFTTPPGSSDAGDEDQLGPLPSDVPDDSWSVDGNDGFPDAPEAAPATGARHPPWPSDVQVDVYDDSRLFTPFSIGSHQFPFRDELFPTGSSPSPPPSSSVPAPAPEPPSVHIERIVRPGGLVCRSLLEDSYSFTDAICVRTNCTSQSLTGTAAVVASSLPYSQVKLPGRKHSLFAFQSEWRHPGSITAYDPDPFVRKGSPVVFHLHCAWSAAPPSSVVQPHAGSNRDDWEVHPPSDDEAARD